jgi:hypothetical protein
MSKRLKKQRPTKAQVKAITEIGDALKLNGFLGENYWSHKRSINYVSVSIGFDYQLHVRVIHGSIKEGWEDFVLPLEVASVGKICSHL